MKSFLFSAALLYLGFSSLHAQVNILYEVDSLTNTVKQISPTGVVTNFYSGGGLLNPEGLTVDSAGNLYIANSNNQIKKLTFTGTLTLFTGSTNAPSGMVFDSSGNMFEADLGSGKIQKITPAGVVTTFVSGLNLPTDVAFDASGNLYESDNGTNSIIKITPGGVQSTFAFVQHPTGLAFDSLGNLYVDEDQFSTIKKITPAGVLTTFVGAGLNNPKTLTIDSADNLYEGDYGTATVKKITPAGVVSTYASGFNLPDGLHFGAVPEPTIYALLVGGLGLLGLVSSRKFKAKERA